MDNRAETVRQHYGMAGLLPRVDAYLREHGVDPERATSADYFPFDQLHGRAMQATREHLERAGIQAHMHVLDLGCGVGGATRVLATTCGCRVTAVDLTPEFIEVARELTRRCNLADRIEYLVADALDLPFADGTFDHVWCHNVTMNIPDKHKFAAEVARVLKPGGRLSCAEVGQGPGGPLIFPLPFATDASASFVVTPEEMRQAITAGGLRITAAIDLSAANRAGAGQSGEAGPSQPPRTAHWVIYGDGFAERMQNAIRCEKEQRMVEHFILAEKI